MIARKYRRRRHTRYFGCECTTCAQMKVYTCEGICYYIQCKKCGEDGGFALFDIDCDNHRKHQFYPVGMRRLKPVPRKKK